MNNVSHKKTWTVGEVQVHMEPQPTPLIKIKHNNNSENYFIKLKCFRDTISAKSDLYDFKMDFFDNGESEEFLLLVRNFNMTLAASGMLGTEAKVKCLCMLVRVEVLCQFDLLSDHMEGTNPLTSENIILGLAAYFPPVNSPPKKKRAMRRGTRNPRVLKVRLYTAILVELNKYLALFPGEKLTEKLAWRS